MPWWSEAQTPGDLSAGLPQRSHGHQAFTMRGKTLSLAAILSRQQQELREMQLRHKHELEKAVAAAETAKQETVNKPVVDLLRQMQAQLEVLAKAVPVAECLHPGIPGPHTPAALRMRRPPQTPSGPPPESPLCGDEQLSSVQPLPGPDDPHLAATRGRRLDKEFPESASSSEPGEETTKRQGRKAKSKKKAKTQTPHHEPEEEAGFETAGPVEDEV